MDIDLSQYVRVGRFDLPEPTRTSAPINNLLAQEASAITYNWDTDTLFVVGDGGTSIVQAEGERPRDPSRAKDQDRAVLERAAAGAVGIGDLCRGADDPDLARRGSA